MLKRFKKSSKKSLTQTELEQEYNELTQQLTEYRRQYVEMKKNEPQLTMSEYHNLKYLETILEELKSDTMRVFNELKQIQLAS